VVERVSGELVGLAPPATKPVTRPQGKPERKPADAPEARPASKPKGAPRQLVAARVAAAAAAVLVLFAVTAGATQIGLHGLSFFVFRAAGTGETGPTGLQENQGPGQPNAPKPTSSHVTVAVHNVKRSHDGVR
jgi:hypothetical protein